MYTVPGGQVGESKFAVLIGSDALIRFYDTYLDGCDWLLRIDLIDCAVDFPGGIWGLLSKCSNGADRQNEQKTG